MSVVEHLRGLDWLDQKLQAISTAQGCGGAWEGMAPTTSPPSQTIIIYSFTTGNDVTNFSGQVRLWENTIFRTKVTGPETDWARIVATADAIDNELQNVSQQVIGPNGDCLLMRCLRIGTESYPSEEYNTIKQMSTGLLWRLFIKSLV